MFGYRVYVDDFFVGIGGYDGVVDVVECGVDFGVFCGEELFGCDVFVVVCDVLDLFCGVV